MSSIRKRQWKTPTGEKRTAWVVDYRDAAGKRRSKQFARKKDADAWSVSALSEVRNGVHTPDSISITVAKAAEFWLESVRASDREPTTIGSYEQHIRLHIVPRCGALKLSQITAPKVRALLDSWLSDLSRAMAIRVFRSFKAIVTDAQARGLVAQNVALAVKVPKAPRKKRSIAIPTKQEIREILTAAATSPDIMGRALVELMIFTGMRASELRGLAWPSVDFKKGYVRVEQRADVKGLIGSPKSLAGFRTIPLPERVVSTLREWKVACPPHPRELVFPSQTGQILSHGVMLKNHLNPILIAAGVIEEGRYGEGSKAKYSAHAFRHAAASMWIEQGLNPKRVQTLVGHGSIQVTFDTYGHLFDDAHQGGEAAQAIELALFSKVSNGEIGQFS